jgi:hypothetical protein
MLYVNVYFKKSKYFLKVLKLPVAKRTMIYDFIILIYFKLSYLEIAVGAVLARVRC